MGVPRRQQTQLLPTPPANQHWWTRVSDQTAHWAQNLFSNLLTARTARRLLQATVSSAYIGSVLCEPALAQSGQGLNWMGTFEHPRGSRSEYSTPSGFSCRFEQGERPSLSIGAGVAEPPVLNGYGNQFYFAEPRVEKPAPVGGVFITIPLGVDRGSDCIELMEVENIMLKLQHAKTMMMDGLITEEQLKAVVDKAYSFLNR